MTVLPFLTCSRAPSTNTFTKPSGAGGSAGAAGAPGAATTGADSGATAAVGGLADTFWVMVAAAVSAMAVFIALVEEVAGALGLALSGGFNRAGLPGWAADLDLGLAVGLIGFLGMGY